MKRVYSSLNGLLVDNLYNALEQEGIHCEVRNRHGSSMVGAIPVSEAFTELWIADEQAELAQRRIDEELGGHSPAENRSWTCPQCGNEVDPGFAACWYCTDPSNSSERHAEESPPHAAESRSPTNRTSYRWFILIGLLLLYLVFVR